MSDEELVKYFLYLEEWVVKDNFFSIVVLKLLSIMLWIF